MNVKQLCNMIYKDDCPVKIRIGYREDFNTELNIYNPFHMVAYGDFKVDSFRALDADSYEISIAVTPIQPIIEK